MDAKREEELLNKVEMLETQLNEVKAELKDANDFIYKSCEQTCKDQKLLLDEHDKAEQLIKENTNLVMKCCDIDGERYRIRMELENANSKIQDLTKRLQDNREYFQKEHDKMLQIVKWVGLKDKCEQLEKENRKLCDELQRERQKNIEYQEQDNAIISFTSDNESYIYQQSEEINKQQTKQQKLKIKHKQKLKKEYTIIKIKHNKVVGVIKQYKKCSPQKISNQIVSGKYKFIEQTSEIISGFKNNLQIGSDISQSHQSSSLSL